jgi:hypothetical protein
MRATAFAKNIAARFTGRAWLWAPEGFVFRLDRPANSSQYFHNHVLLQIAPSLALTVLSSPKQPLITPDHPLLPSMPRSMLGKESEALHRVVRSTRSVMPEELVERLILHRRRIERENHQRIDETPVRSAVSFVPPAGRVLRHSAPVKPEHQDVKQQGPKNYSGFEQPPESIYRPVSRLAPELNVNQLTDQVIRMIDQRILAQRERLGKV